MEINIVALACHTDHIEFWQHHLFNKFTVPFDRIIRSSITFKGVLKLVRAGQSLPLFWQNALCCWCNFHYYSPQRFLESDEDYQEVLNRPVAFNSTITTVLHSKAYLPMVPDKFEEIGWYTVADMIKNNSDKLRIPQLACYSRVKQLVKNVLIGWTGFIDQVDPLFYTFAQRVIDQKVSLRQFYCKLLLPDFTAYQRKWSEQDGVVCEIGRPMLGKVIY